MLLVRRSPLLRFVLLPVALLMFSACHHWVPLEPPLDRTIAHEEPGRVRLFQSGRAIELRSPSISGDSIIGFADRRTAIPIAGVCGAEERKIDTGPTVFATIGALSIAFIGLAVLQSATYNH
jgi:hypothetical protein